MPNESINHFQSGVVTGYDGRVGFLRTRKARKALQLDHSNSKAKALLNILQPLIAARETQ